MSRGFKIFFVVLIGLMLWMTVVDSFYMVPQYGLPVLAVLFVAIVFVIVRIVRAK